VTLSTADLRVSLLQTTFAFLPRERQKGSGRSRDVEVSRTTGCEAGERMRGQRDKIPMVSIASFEPASAWLSMYKRNNGGTVGSSVFNVVSAKAT
jgi:hypothetical protein